MTLIHILPSTGIPIDQEERRLVVVFLGFYQSYIWMRITQQKKVYSGILACFSSSKALGEFSN